MFKIYYSKAMKNVACPTESIEFSRYNKSQIEKRLNERDSNVHVKFFMPEKYYNYDEQLHETEKEIFRFELENVRNSNLIIYEERGIWSTGATVELAIAYENRIPIIILNEKNIELHPWIEHMANRVFSDREELTNYVLDYYLD